jgi:CopG family transcriptional regulator / antitoxin EndoAI
MVYNRINITLPTETLQQLNEFVSKGERSRFINSAIQAYISEIQQEKLRQKLKEGAIQRADRDRSLADDWLTLEEEAWQEKAK